MAGSIRRTTSHIRSSSWPSTSHPLDSSVEALLHKLTTSKLEPSSTASSICTNLSNIKELYEGINHSIGCPLNQRALSLEQHQASVEEVLEGSLSLLEACSSTNDVLSLLREAIVELQSCLRRKSGEQEKGLHAYMMSRKKIQKMANKCLKKLNKINSQQDRSYSVSIVRMLREAEIVSFFTLKSIMTYLSTPTITSRSWSLMTKVMNSKHVSCERQRDSNEIEKIDSTVFAFEGKKTNKDVKMAQDLLKQLATLELSVQEIEGSLESISRCLLRTRVSLLNIISH
ncbi:uncharacterized protein LOC104884261 [Beta vulgaris subsp. vulgaris]|uniref:uncharacterized protein LOC104884261 n=1 Tax=Beta vulgaris subsp. vulgaris TaxID=3555 RepID=UPI00053FF899|nr:uncharacterized protein LOC104884261 [Beta vulgaris subsp. vulgaris]